MLDLILALECGGCGQPGTRWCDSCASALEVAEDQPHLVAPRSDPGVPVFALGRYAGPRRQAIVALKEHRRTDLVGPLARSLALGVHRLISWGILAPPLVIVPAPTRWLAARRRGGDPVTKLAVAAVGAHPQVTVAPILRMRAMARDSVGLNIGGRERNIAGRIVRTARPPNGVDVLLIDDIVTTGATARESARVLHTGGGNVTAVLALAHA